MSRWNWAGHRQVLLVAVPIVVSAILVIRADRRQWEIRLPLAPDAHNAIETFELDPDVHTDVTDYPNARHIVADQFENLILAYVDSNQSSGSAIVLAYSTASARTWTACRQPFGRNAQRPALAYSVASDTLHMVYHQNGSDERSELHYRRYSIDRKTDRRIAGLHADGDLLLHAGNASRATLLWTPDGAEHGSIVTVWTAFDGGSARQILASMRRLSNGNEDFLAPSWSTPDGSPDRDNVVPGARVPVDIVDVDSSSPVPMSYNGRYSRLGLASLVQRRNASAPHNRDLYVMFALAGPDAGWKWRKISWNSEQRLWSGERGWTEPQLLVVGNFNTGRTEKELTLSTVYDESSDTIWISAAHYVAGASAAGGGNDTISLFGIGPDDTARRVGEIYVAPGESSRHPMSSIALDVRSGISTVFAAYVTGNQITGDGEIRIRSFTPSGGFGPSELVYSASPNNYPNLIERSENARLTGVFRTNTDPHTLRLATVDLSRLLP